MQGYGSCSDHKKQHNKRGKQEREERKAGIRPSRTDNKIYLCRCKPKSACCKLFGDDKIDEGIRASILEEREELAKEWEKLETEKEIFFKQLQQQENVAGALNPVWMPQPVKLGLSSSQKPVTQSHGGNVEADGADVTNVLQGLLTLENQVCVEAGVQWEVDKDHVRCSREQCDRECFKVGKTKFAFCSRTCGLAAAEELKAKVGVCVRPGCNMIRFKDPNTGQVFKHCGRTCRDAGRAK